MKNPPRPRRQRHQQTQSAQPRPVEPSAPHESDGSARPQSGASSTAPGPRKRSRRDRYAGQGAHMARKARERKAQAVQSEDTQTRGGLVQGGRSSVAPLQDAQTEIPRATISQTRGATARPGQDPPPAGDERRSRTSEHGQAIRRMRAPIGADDAADILGPRDDAPQEAHVERIEERIRARKRLTAVHILSAGGAAVAMVLLAWVLFFSSLFALAADRIEIASNDPSVAADAVHAQVAPFVGTPLTRLSLTDVEESIEGITQIKDAHVTRVWPRGLSVTFTVRAAAMVAQINGSLVALDDEGVELGPVAQRPAGVPLVALPEDSTHRSENAQGVIAAWKALPEDLRGRVESMTVANHHMTIALQEGRQVRWGTLTDEELKARVLQVLLAQREAKVYDVSSPTSPVTSG